VRLRSAAAGDNAGSGETGGRIVPIDRAERLRVLKEPRWRRARNIALGVVVGAVFLVGLVETCVPVWWYATGTSTRATIERCWNEGASKGKGPTVCHGRWTLPDGTRGSGDIVGPGKDDVGTTMPVRAGQDRAAEPGWRLFGYPLLLIAVPTMLFYVPLQQRRKRGR
jgi:hypothetical protein